MKKLLMPLVVTMLFLSIFIGFTQPGIASPLSKATNQVGGEENTSDVITIQNQWATYLGATYAIYGAISNHFYNAPARVLNVPGAYGTSTGTVEYSNINHLQTTQ
ncbi:hypothetical protein ACFSFY_00290 [Sporosarcina siberiensis]|uniref:Uncharacterized protein n=1 Tax=Sporosarcina siberiensis TaxID=1365606 RepID=A0ABW4SB85_9BACL